MSYYKTIDGIKYDRALLDAADELVAGVGDGRISFEDAKLLIGEALDGGRITHTERRTLLYIMDTYKVTDKARKWLEEQLLKFIGDKTYDTQLLEAAELAVAGVGDGRISTDDAKEIWDIVAADGKITELERRTMAYIMENYKVTDKARAYLEEQLG